MSKKVFKCSSGQVFKKKVGFPLSSLSEKAPELSFPRKRESGVFTFVSNLQVVGVDR